VGLPTTSTARFQSLEALVSVTPEKFREERDIDLRTGHTVIAIDPTDRTVTAETNGETVATYIRLALTATRDGRAVGQTVANEPIEAGGAAGTAVVKTSGVEAARTGILEETDTRHAGFDPVRRPRL